MSKKCCVEYRGRGFWAFDESLAILLYLAADMAESRAFAGDFSQEEIQQWRTTTFLGSDTGLQLDDVCADDRRRERFIELMLSCGDQLRQMREISGGEVLAWRALGEKVIWRGAPGSVVSTTPIISPRRCHRTFRSRRLATAAIRALVVDRVHRRLRHCRDAAWRSADRVTRPAP
jgi:hypothetical protein